jgi:hypothetical protein
MTANIASKDSGSNVRGDTAIPDLAAVCWEALYSQNEAAALAKLRLHARLIVGNLGDEAICEALTVDPPGSVSKERIAAVYEILAQAEPGAPLPVDTGREVIAANLDEEQEIGLAFKNELLHGLGPVLNNLVVYFAATPRVSRKEERRLAQTASASAAWPEAGGLVACGLTPLSVFYATRNVESLVRRSRQAGTRAEDSLTLAPLRGAKPPCDLHVSLAYRVACEIVQVNRCSKEAALALIDWMIEVSKIKPLLFAGYWAEPEGAGVRLVPQEDYSHKLLSDRWRETRSAKPEPTAAPATEVSARARC